jgi:hypothetical protein
VAGRPEALGQQLLVVVLGEAEDERERADAAADVPERGDGELPGPVAEVEAVEPEPGGNHLVGVPELATKKRVSGPGRPSRDACPGPGPFD